MSSSSPILPPLGLPLKYRRKSLSADESPPPNWSAIHRSSSPFTPSSPVPPTPTFASSNHSYAYIQSSPRLPFDVGVREADELSDSCTSLWNRGRRQTKPRYALPSFRSSFPSDDELPCTSDFDISELSEDIDADEYPSVSYRRYSDLGPSTEYFTDGDDGEPVIELDIIDQDLRGTFFSTSAERGRWRSDPVPFTTRLRNLTQTSRSVPPRPTSKPAPVDDAKGRDAASLTTTLAHSNRDTPPPTITQNDDIYSLSPLPPSSAPMSPVSPMSFVPMSPLSLAPVSLASSVPVSPTILETCLPKATSSCMGTPEQALHESVEFRLPDPVEICPVKSHSPIIRHASVPPAETECAPTSEKSNLTSPLSNPSLSLDSQEDTPSPIQAFHSQRVVSTSDGLPSQNPTSPPIASSMLPSHSPFSSPKQRPKTLTQLIIPVDVTSIRASPVAHKQNQPSSYAGSSESPLDMDVDVLMAKARAQTEGAGPGPKRDKGSRRTRGKREGGLMTKTKGRVDGVDYAKAVEAAKDAKKVKRKHGEEISERPVRKKSRLFTEQAGDAPSGEVRESGTDLLAGKKGVGRTRKHSLDPKTDTHKAGPSSSKRHAQKHKTDGHDSKCTAARQRPHPTEDADTDPPVLPKAPQRDPSPSWSAPLSPQAATALHAEIRGLLIESMAASRASSLPASALYKTVMQNRPALRAQRDERAWLAVFARVLTAGQGGVFGRVESSGKDHADRPLEARWFYVPEGDEDQERAALVRSMMPRPGKRSTTKEYKQYYYRPLEKMSRWDPEDEM